MSTKTKVLAIDDEPWNLEILQHYLDEEFDLTLAENGEEGLVKLEQSGDFDLVLLDVSMPGLDGYQVCEKIRENQAWDNIPVIFISARGTVEERLRGYKAGGDDYLVKPFECDELLAKMSLLEKYKREKEDLSDSIQGASSVAMEAMNSNRELGLALQFSKKSYSVQCPSELATLLIESLQDLGINATLRLNTKKGIEWQQSAGHPSPLEKELIELLAAEDRIFSFDRRTQFNFEYINLLVKNMPVEDENKLGRYKDLMPFFLESADACLNAIGDRETVENHEKLQTAIMLVDRVINEQKALMCESHDIMTDIFDDLNQTLEYKIPTMGLEEDQEQYLIHLIDEKVTQASSASDIRKRTDDAFEKISSTLRSLVSVKRSLMDESARSSK